MTRTDTREGTQAPRSLTSEVFHDLSQPLTALHCTLDLSLRRDKTIIDLRHSIQDALENAERLRQRLLLIRALNDASDPGEPSATTDLNDLLREIHDDVLPLFESADSKLEVTATQPGLAVRAERIRLMRGLFYFVEYLFRYSQSGATTRIEAFANEAGQAELRITSRCSVPVAWCDAADGTPYSCEIEMLRRTCRAVGGEFELIARDADADVWRALLPLQ